MTLAQVKKGQKFKIVFISDQNVRDQAVRFGLTEGETAFCLEVIPAGPVIIRKNYQEIAVGRGLAALIQIVPLN